MKNFLIQTFALSMIALNLPVAQAATCGGRTVCVGATILDYNSNFKGQVSSIETNGVIHFLNLEFSGATGMTTNERCRIIDNSVCGGDSGGGSAPAPVTPAPQPFNPQPPVSQPGSGPSGALDSTQYYRLENLNSLALSIKYNLQTGVSYGDDYLDFNVGNLMQNCRKTAESFQRDSGVIVTRFGVRITSRSGATSMLSCDAEYMRK